MPAIMNLEFLPDNSERLGDDPRAIQTLELILVVKPALPSALESNDFVGPQFHARTGCGAHLDVAN